MLIGELSQRTGVSRRALRCYADARRYLPCARGTEPWLEMCPALRSRLLERAAELEAREAALARQRAALTARLTGA